MAGAVLAKLGVVPQQIPGGDIYPALEKARSTRRNGSGPTTTRSSASTRSPSTTTTRAGGRAGAALGYVNLGQWEKLPKNYQAILTAACAEAEFVDAGKYDTENLAALRRLVANGASCGRSRSEILDACYKAAQEFYAETAAKNAK